MAKKHTNDSAQTVLAQRFEFKFDDTMVSVAGVEADFGKTNIAATVVALFDLPPGAIVVGGDITTLEAFDAATYTVFVGDLIDPDRYLASADNKALGRSALLVTGYVHQGGIVGLSFTAADVCTTGRMAVTLQYIIKDRANEGA